MMKIEFSRAKERCWAEISRSALSHNISAIRQLVPADTMLCGVVKADAYGHNAVNIARILETEAFEYLAVASLDEAIELREAGISMPILTLGPAPASEYQSFRQYRITPCIGSLTEALAFHDKADGGPALPCHLKFDSGLARLGFSLREPDFERTVQDVLTLAKDSSFVIEGLMTHFAEATDVEGKYFNLQSERFEKLISTLQQENIKVKYIHSSNSAGTVRLASGSCNMIRPGIALYGCYDGEIMKERLKLRPVMSLKARISTIRLLEADESVSYSRKYFTPEQMRIAVVECGYADGFMRLLSNRASVLLKGKRTRILGNICMDRCMIDLREFPDAKVGDIATLFGTDGESILSADEQGELIGTISYELLARISARVPRLLVD